MLNTGTENKTLVLQIAQAKTENNRPQLIDLLSSDLKVHVSDRPSPLDREAYIQEIQLCHAAFSPLAFHVLDMVTEGDKIAVRLQIQGKHIGKYQHFHPSDQEVSFYSMLMCRIREGKVIEEWQVNDHLSMFQQMGLSVNHLI